MVDGADHGDDHMFKAHVYFWRTSLVGFCPILICCEQMKIVGFYPFWEGSWWQNKMQRWLPIGQDDQQISGTTEVIWGCEDCCETTHISSTTKEGQWVDGKSTWLVRFKQQWWEYKDGQDRFHSAHLRKSRIMSEGRVCKGKNDFVFLHFFTLAVVVVHFFVLLWVIAGDVSAHISRVLNNMLLVVTQSCCCCWYCCRWYCCYCCCYC